MTLTVFIDGRARLTGGYDRSQAGTVARVLAQQWPALCRMGRVGIAVNDGGLSYLVATGRATP